MRLNLHVKHRVGVNFKPHLLFDVIRQVPLIRPCLIGTPGLAEGLVVKVIFELPSGLPGWVIQLWPMVSEISWRQARVTLQQPAHGGVNTVGQALKPSGARGRRSRGDFLLE